LKVKNLPCNLSCVELWPIIVNLSLLSINTLIYVDTINLCTSACIRLNQNSDEKYFFFLFIHYIFILFIGFIHIIIDNFRIESRID